MTSQTNPVPASIVVTGPAVLMALACNHCRTVMFARNVEDMVARGLDHAQECGSSSIVIAELVTGNLDVR